MADGDPSEPRTTLLGVAVPRPETGAPATAAPEPVPNPAVTRAPNPGSWSGQARTTTLLPQQQPATAAPSQQAIAPYGGPVPQPDGTVGDGPIRVVCRRCQRTIWGWKLPFGVSCPMGPHHSHINWFLVAVVASFWAAFAVFVISLIGIAA